MGTRATSSGENVAGPTEAGGKGENAGAGQNDAPRGGEQAATHSCWQTCGQGTDEGEELMKNVVNGNG